MKTVHIKFANSSQNYEYYLLPGQIAEVGDYVIVDSPYGGYQCVKVTNTSLEGKATKSVVDVVDDRQYKENAEKDKRRQALVKELEKIAKREDEKNKYQWLAVTNPEARKLYEELQGL